MKPKQSSHSLHDSITELAKFFKLFIFKQYFLLIPPQEVSFSHHRFPTLRFPQTILLMLMLFLKFLLLQIKESKKHNGWVGFQKIKPNPSSRSSSLQLVTQESMQEGSEYLQRRRIHNFSGHIVPVLCNPLCNEVFPHVRMEFPTL